MTTREVFDFVTDITIPPGEEDARLSAIESVAREREAQSSALEIDDAVFREAYIPRTLDEV